MSNLSGKRLTLTGGCGLFTTQVNTNVISAALNLWEVFNGNTGVPATATVLHPLTSVDGI